MAAAIQQTMTLYIDATISRTKTFSQTKMCFCLANAIAGPNSMIILEKSWDAHAASDFGHFIAHFGVNFL